MQPLTTRIKGWRLITIMIDKKQLKNEEMDALRQALLKDTGENTDKEDQKEDK